MSFSGGADADYTRAAERQFIARLHWRVAGERERERRKFGAERGKLLFFLGAGGGGGISFIGSLGRDVVGEGFLRV